MNEVGLHGIAKAEASRAYRTLMSRLAIVESPDGTSLADHLRRSADAIEAVERDECVASEGVSHAVVEYEGGDGIWTTVLVIE